MLSGIPPVTVGLGFLLAMMASAALSKTVSVPIPPEQQIIRLQGEHAAAGFFINAPAEAEQLTVVANLSIASGLDSQRSFVRFMGNGAELGRVSPKDIRNASVKVRFALDQSQLRPGSNHIRITSSLVPDRIQSIDESYDLYAEIEITEVTLDGGKATNDELALALLASGPAAQGLHLAAINSHDSARAMARWIPIVQAYAQLQRGAPPPIHLAEPRLMQTAPGHRIVIGTQAELEQANQNGALHDLPLTTGGPVIDDNGYVTWVITERTNQALNAALERFINRLPGATERLPRPQPGSLFTLDPWLSDLADRRARLQRREVAFLLPYNYQPQRAPERARVEVPIKADTEVETRVQVAINGRFLAEQTVAASRSTAPGMLSIALPWSSYAAGLNTLTLRITTAEPAADTQGTPIDLVEPVRLYIPRSMNERITPRVAGALTAPPTAQNPRIDLFAKPDNQATREALLTLLANLVSLTGQRVEGRYYGGNPGNTDNRALVVGTPNVVALEPLIMPGLSSATVTELLTPVSEVDRHILNNPVERRIGRKIGWPARVARDQRQARDEQNLLSPPQITDWSELATGAGLAIEDSVPEAMNGQRRDVFYLLAADSAILPAIARSLTQRDLSGFNNGASLLSVTGGWQDFAYTVAGTNAGRSATGTRLALLNRIGRLPLTLITTFLLMLIIALALLGNRALTRGRNHRA